MSKKFFLCLVFICSAASAQSLVNDLYKDQENVESDLFTETVKLISESKKIFILTNENQQLSSGDFITLVLDDTKAARALVAKNHQGRVGIKILKIFSLNSWSKIRKDGTVQIIRGDDSWFGKKLADQKEDENKIKTEDELYTGDITTENEFIGVEDKSKRHIQPDNIVSAAFGFNEADEINGKKIRANTFSGGWAYQFADNIFAEFYYARTYFGNYPAEGINTLQNNFIARIKYNFKAPLYSFIMPYIGYSQVSVSSPDAGQGTTTVQAQNELKVIDKLRQSGPAFGVTLLRRMVPGWFIKADLGTDLLNVGFAIEF